MSIERSAFNIFKIVGVATVVAAINIVSVEDDSSSTNLCSPAEKVETSVNPLHTKNSVRLRNEIEVNLGQIKLNFFKTLDCMRTFDNPQIDDAILKLEGFWREYQSGDNQNLDLISSGSHIHQNAKTTVAPTESGLKIRIGLSVPRFTDPEFSSTEAAGELFGALIVAERIEDPQRFMTDSTYRRNLESIAADITSKVFDRLDMSD